MRCTCPPLGWFRDDPYFTCAHCEQRAEGDERDAQNEAHADAPEEWDNPEGEEEAWLT